VKRPAIAVTACAALFAGLALAAAAGSTEPADGWIVDAMAAPSNVSYTGTVEVVRFGGHGSEASMYRIEHRAPNLTQRLYTSPENLRGDEVVTRGTESYAVDVRRHRVVETKNEASDDQIARDDNYLLLRANYRAVAQGTQSVDGHDVQTVALINNYTRASTLLVRIDTATKLVLDKQQFAADGSMLSEVRFEDVNYGQSIPDGDFAVPDGYPTVKGVNVGKPSDDVAGVARRVGFSARCPKTLTDGFSAVEGSVIHPRRTPALHVLYSDGIRTVSLFESSGAPAPDFQDLRPAQTTIAGHDALYAERGPTDLLTWNDGTLQYTLVGDLRIDELSRIAANLMQT
jgi:negative regulator of sigma E activity